MGRKRVNGNEREKKVGCEFIKTLYTKKNHINFTVLQFLNKLKASVYK
jgi:hypothetical protein